MTDKPTNWMDQAGNLFKQWTDQQQALLRNMSAGSGPLEPTATAKANAPADMGESLRQAQDLWQSSMEKWAVIAKQALPQSGITSESLKRLFDPSQWAQAGLGPLDAAIEHLVEGPNYATLWTLDRKMLKAQKLRAEWAKDLAAYQVLMHSAWSEAVKRFLREINDAQGTPITSWRELTDVWIDVANKTLVETHRTPEFLEAQRRLTRSGAECSPAGARDRRGVLRNAADADAHGEWTSCSATCTNCAAACARSRGRGMAMAAPGARPPSTTKKPLRGSRRASPNSKR